ncbi:hypothetical protein [Acinetobacter nosocomialis]|uniref:hypothetical protein n=1 Tax=Acinetobacter nosocomialis TaxID=106654 RepID=UPI0024DE2BCB|nr:hypothetical protein [Acinetobacter nosocomialis]
MRSSLQLFPEIKIASVEALTVAHSEANNELANLGALLLAIELSLVEKLKDHDLSKLAFDKTLRLIEIAKSNVELAQDFHNGALSEITGSEHQFDELKNSIAHLDLHQDSPLDRVNIDGLPERQTISPLSKEMTYDERR